MISKRTAITTILHAHVSNRGRQGVDSPLDPRREGREPGDYADRGVGIKSRRRIGHLLQAVTQQEVMTPTRHWRLLVMPAEKVFTQLSLSNSEATFRSGAVKQVLLYG